MPRSKAPEDLTVDELRQLLVEKRRKVRQEHLERFRRTGRVVTLASDLETPSLEHLHTDIPNASAPDGPPTIRQRGWRIFDRALIIVEILAVIGLVFVIFNGWEILRNLNDEFAQALVPATLTPTPLIGPVVLPSGHTPPDSPGGARYNEAEIPEHLRPLVQAVAEIPSITPSPEQAIQLQIPTIQVDAPIVLGDGWEQLKKGVGQHIGSSNPGQDGNLVLSAHNDVFGQIFRYLDQLKRGDEVIVYTAQRAYVYVVTGTLIVEPTAVEVMAASSDPTLTLISCYPYLVDNQRIVVQAVLASNTP
ncbi:MAG TPA: class D sortase [Anaerolineales bacterium]|nr:class D sortase [Anaerolineales bacterium]